VKNHGHEHPQFITQPAPFVKVATPMICSIVSSRWYTLLRVRLPLRTFRLRCTDRNSHRLYPHHDHMQASIHLYLSRRQWSPQLPKEFL